jgi:uncharacterized protein YegL
MTDQMITPKKKSKKAPKNTRIFFILDRSGSMASIADETIGGFNAFVEAQKAVPGKATLSLVQFDHEYLVVHNGVPLQDVPLLDKTTFVPRGMTALYDAVGRTIAQFKDDNPKDTKTIVTILTDGAENSSKEFTYSQISQMIKQVEADHGWEVMFLGANMNAQVVAANMGIKASSSVTFDYSKVGAVSAMSSINAATSSLRGMSMNYADGSSVNDSLDMSKLYADVGAGKVTTAPTV